MSLKHRLIGRITWSGSWARPSYLLVLIHAVTDWAYVAGAVDIDENFVEFAPDLILQSQYCAHVERVHDLVLAAGCRGEKVFLSHRRDE